MRLKVGRLRRLVKRDLPIEFGREQLTSYGGLELLRRYFQVIGLTQRLPRRPPEQQLGGHVSRGLSASSAPIPPQRTRAITRCSLTSRRPVRFLGSRTAPAMSTTARAPRPSCAS